jgi:hypothetical protein
LVENRFATEQYREVADRGFVSACVWQVPVFPDDCSSFLSAVLLCCFIVGKVADTLRQRDICAGGWQSEVLCHMYYGGSRYS